MKSYFHIVSPGRKTQWVLTLTCLFSLGRKKTIWFGFTPFIIGIILQTGSYSVVQLGSFISGLRTGLETSTVPIFQAEISRPDKRGSLVAAEPQSVAFGITVSYWIGYGCSKRFDQPSWRFPVGIQTHFAKLAFSHQHVSTDDPMVVDLIDQILYLQDVEGEGDKISWGMILSGKDAMHGRYRIFLAAMVQFWNQFGGINMVVYYVPLVLETNVGLSTNMSTILGGCIMVCFFVLAMIGSSLGQMGSVLLITVLLSVGGKSCSAGAVVFFFAYIAFFAATMNCASWVYAVEILPFGVAAIMFYFFCPKTCNRSPENIENTFLYQNTMFYGVNDFNRNPISMDEKAVAHTDHAEHVEKSKKLMEDV
ncbi:uncharacterized protein OGAPODRAFT_24127 [Ogataea polymorpha]|uniref:uncharacterized protein n=1 Tax=Ogataea polymorpha TaxID=460523 RepID=UPI0007F3C59F|nr:uncharacterized protein OGAPODRAFT_24127 [Ogataea polymorpha]OBA15370.1 hypothetical protein OGAPODRAFT_24127 [Ogataea polymorpha]